MDGIARAYRFKIFGWALFAGLPLGGFADYAMGQTALGLVLGPVKNPFGHRRTWSD